jgi:pimeloyl-ACP methyl ester carboxylesterase
MAQNQQPNPAFPRLAPEKITKRWRNGSKGWPMLEVIDKGQCTDKHPVPLLFVHGGCLAAWCWDEHFLDFFSDRGFRAVAVSWRGHGESTLSKPLSRCSIADYLEDVCWAADKVDGQPVLIGHSTGGFLVQKYLENRNAPAGVLLASTPPQGILRASMRVWLRHPWVAVRANTFGQSHEVFNTPKRAREYLFCSRTPEPLVESGATRAEPDSLRAVFVDQVFRLPKPERVTTPLLVLGAEEDGLVTNAEVRATARSYGTQAELFPGMGHMMMLEPGWQAVAERIDGWLAGQGL